MPTDTRTESWIDLTAELVTRTWTPQWRLEVFRALIDTFDAAASWNWMHPDGSFGFEATGVRARWPTEGELARWQADLRASHPLIHWYAMTSDPAALTIDRVPHSVVPRRDFGAAREFYRAYELEQQISLPLYVDGWNHEAFVMGRSGSDFSEEDLAVARQIQPLLRLLARQACVLSARNGCIPGTADLTPREAAVLNLVAEGRTAAAMGRRLGISERTVHKHLEHAYRKLGARDRVSAVAAARAAGVFEPSAGPRSATAPTDGLYVFAHRP